MNKQEDLVDVGELQRSLTDIFKRNNELLNRYVITHHLDKVGFDEEDPPSEISSSRAHDFLGEIQDSYGFEDGEINEVKEEVGLETEEI